ncbi:MAG: hypothetical protein OEY49_14590 [Candidatus Heimdallarchaeota archaeon]|nr:hypothetical protein [Candidatus Heimdallarchaeota archaeon]
MLINSIVEFFRRKKYFEHISIHEAKEKMDKGELVILDFRIQVSRDNGYIDGSLHFEVHKIKKHLKDLPKDKLQ